MHLSQRGRVRPFAALRDRPCERAGGSTRKRSSAEGVGAPRPTVPETPCQRASSDPERSFWAMQKSSAVSAENQGLLKDRARRAKKGRAEAAFRSLASIERALQARPFVFGSSSVGLSCAHLARGLSNRGPRLSQHGGDPRDLWPQLVCRTITHLERVFVSALVGEGRIFKRTSGATRRQNRKALGERLRFGREFV
jgi:hypothetical protein